AVPSPVFPVNLAAITSGFFSFGTCHSQDKGWMVGGSFFNGTAAGAEAMNSGFLYEFNPQQEQWAKKAITNPHYFEDPITYYYNNSIYVLGGTEVTYLVGIGGQLFGQTRKHLQKVKRLDLATLTWNSLDSTPLSSRFNLASFEINNEWYIGMGANSDSLSACCGNPLPSKKFYKFNPSMNQWTRLADFPGGHQNFPTCFSIGSNGYAFYGAVGTSLQATTFNQELWKYNAPANTWSRVALPVSGGPAQGEKYQIITHEGKAYFLTAQKHELFSYYYGFSMQNVFLEYDPEYGTFKKVSAMKDPQIIRLIARVGNKFYFHSDAFGYITSLENKTFSFSLD
ncbi:MAG TPA: hypothetical protein VEY06_14285, partial [Flavisolibacter sp.]|nr:hypothetical protein [Flavisolibacter sp.]